MSERMKYCTIVKREGKVLLKTENNYPNKLILILSCKLEDNYADAVAKELVFDKFSRKTVY
jgi:hypothetical protein